MGGPEQVVGALAVLEPEDAVAVVGPAARGLIGLARQQRRERELLGADGVHLLADDRLDLAQHPQARAAARCRCRAPRGGCSRPGRAAGGSGPRRPPGRRAGCARTGTTSGRSWREGYGPQPFSASVASPRMRGPRPGASPSTTRGPSPHAQARRTVCWPSPRHGVTALALATQRVRRGCRRRPTSSPERCPAAPTSRCRTSRARPSSTATSGSWCGARSCGSSARAGRRTSSPRATSAARSSRILRLADDGSRTLIAKGDVFEAQLASDGLRVLATSYRSKRSTVTAWSVATGQVEVERTFRGYPNLLDARNDVALLGVWGRGTLQWNLTTGSVLRLTKRVGGAASPGGGPALQLHHRPVRRRLHGGQSDQLRPATTCGSRAGSACESFAPGGRRMVTVHILSDGIGPNAASVRTVAGRLVARYARQGSGSVRSTFETPQDAPARDQRQASGRDGPLSQGRLRAGERPRSGAGIPAPASRRCTRPARALTRGPDHRDLQRQPDHGPRPGGRCCRRVEGVDAPSATLPGQTPRSSAALAQPAALRVRGRPCLPRTRARPPR